jgi:hypothetical protein
MGSALINEAFFYQTGHPSRDMEISMATATNFWTITRTRATSALLPRTTTAWRPAWWARRLAAT